MRRLQTATPGGPSWVIRFDRAKMCTCRSSGAALTFTRADLHAFLRFRTCVCEACQRVPV